MKITYVTDDRKLSPEEFIACARQVWPGEYNVERVRKALAATINITAWEGDRLVGCVRILTDGYFFGTIPEIFVAPGWQGQGIGRRLMELAWEASPTSLFFSAWQGNEEFFAKLGYTQGSQSFVRKKLRLTKDVAMQRSDW